MERNVRKELLINHSFCIALLAMLAAGCAALLLICAWQHAGPVTTPFIICTAAMLCMVAALMFTCTRVRSLYTLLLHDAAVNTDRLNDRFHSLFDSIPASLVLVNNEGTIECVNKNWKLFADNNGFSSEHYGVGQNYFAAAGSDSKLVKSLQKMAEGRQDRFSMIYPCHAAGKKRWFRLIAARAQPLQQPGLLLMHIDITDLYTAHDNVQRTQHNLQQIIDLVPHLIFARDSEGNFNFVNKRFAELYGYDSPQKLIHKNIADCAPHATEAQKFLSEDATVMLSGQPGIFPEDIFTDKNGDTHIFHTTKVCYTPADTLKKGILGVAIEITAQKKTETALIKAEANYREIFEKANQGIFILDINTGALINANKKACEITGFTHDELLNASPAAIALISPCALQAGIQHDEAASYAERHHTQEWQLTTKGHQKIWVEVSCNIATIAGVKRIISFFHETDDRKRTALALKQSEAELRSLFAAMTDLVVVLAANGDCLSIAPTGYFESMHNQANFTGQNLAAFLPHDEAAKILNCVKAAIEQQQPVSFEYRLSGEDAETWMEASISPLSDSTVFWVSRNITERKLAQLEHCRITQDLVQKIKDLEQFAYIVSHNLRAPVANILGITNALHAMQLSAEKRERLKADQLTCVKKLDDVIKDLNYILQLKSEVTERKETVRFAQLVTSVQQCIDYLVRKENVVFITDFSKAGEIRTFKSYLYSIFFNLISNSIKYRQPHIKPVIEISTENTGNKTKIIFKDNGLGIDLSRHQQQVFGLYKRFHTHTDGKGVGLYMTKTQVETLGGKISIASSVNQGTAFTIEFDN